MASFASIIGLLLQLMLVVIVARPIFAWWLAPPPAALLRSWPEFDNRLGRHGT
jgi:hypothetical protein